MPEYIEREAMQMALHELRLHNVYREMRGQIYEDTISLAFLSLADIPAADVVEVVRCRECKHRHTGGCPMIGYCNEIDGHAMPLDDDFCSYGEKEDSNGKAN